MQKDKRKAGVSSVPTPTPAAATTPVGKGNSVPRTVPLTLPWPSGDGDRTPDNATDKRQAASPGPTPLTPASKPSAGTTPPKGTPHSASGRVETPPSTKKQGKEKSRRSSRYSQVETTQKARHTPGRRVRRHASSNIKAGDVTLQDFVDERIVKPGDELKCKNRKKETVKGFLTKNGWITDDDDTYPTVEVWLQKRGVRASDDPWKFVTTRNGTPLSQLRDTYVEFKAEVGAQAKEKRRQHLSQMVEAARQEEEDEAFANRVPELDIQSLDDEDGEFKAETVVTSSGDEEDNPLTSSTPSATELLKRAASTSSESTARATGEESAPSKASRRSGKAKRISTQDSGSRKKQKREAAATAVATPGSDAVPSDSWKEELRKEKERREAQEQKEAEKRETKEKPKERKRSRASSDEEAKDKKLSKQKSKVKHELEKEEKEKEKEEKEKQKEEEVKKKKQTEEEERERQIEKAVQKKKEEEEKRRQEEERRRIDEINRRKEEKRLKKEEEEKRDMKEREEEKNRRDDEEKAKKKDTLKSGNGGGWLSKPSNSHAPEQRKIVEFTKAAPKKPAPPPAPSAPETCLTLDSEECKAADCAMDDEVAETQQPKAAENKPRQSTATQLSELRRDIDRREHKFKEIDKLLPSGEERAQAPDQDETQQDTQIGKWGLDTEKEKERELEREREKEKERERELAQEKARGRVKEKQRHKEQEEQEKKEKEEASARKEQDEKEQQERDRRKSKNTPSIESWHKRKDDKKKQGDG
eukprot:TRINITY_DN312_c0_g1_i1.p1 TRINITY_DN312_c0_g1~~TRINITY_DN312_c0_g1_i1.p1  ORF type:complete len:770 (-),score=224.98 TRINITY_DN312_c0_g1_i1:906-3182(-)